MHAFYSFKKSHAGHRRCRRQWLNSLNAADIVSFTNDLRDIMCHYAVSFFWFFTPDSFCLTQLANRCLILNKAFVCCLSGHVDVST